METCYFQDLPMISTFLLFNLSSAGVIVVVRYITFPHILHLFFHTRFYGVCTTIICNHCGSKVLMVSARGFRLGALKTLALSGFSDIHICQNW
ncbi:hypothetical protein Hdeb2414_s0008g00288071 [Helianthus debilis subsp. tardiflorus]